ncbi:MAG: hypothetical protein KAJ23_00350 [Maribacter sp.]|nr:hypothetical protein [Maribacter sp.]
MILTSPFWNWHNNYSAKEIRPSHGHTHGGQITFLGKEFFKPKGSGNYLRGWYRINNLRMYVSKGIGTSGPPFRLGSRAEATVFYI